MLESRKGEVACFPALNGAENHATYPSLDSNTRYSPVNTVPWLGDILGERERQKQALMRFSSTVTGLAISRQSVSLKSQSFPAPMPDCPYSTVLCTLQHIAMCRYVIEMRRTITTIKYKDRDL